MCCCAKYLFVAGMPAICYNIIKVELRNNNVKASSFGLYLRKLSIAKLHAKLLEYEASGFKKAVLREKTTPKV